MQPNFVQASSRLGAIAIVVEQVQFYYPFLKFPSDNISYILLYVPT